jgi:hypothetical protein
MGLSLMNMPGFSSSVYFKVKSKSKSNCDWRSVSKSWCRAPSAAHDQIFITVWQLRSCFVRHPIWREDGSVICIRVPWDSRPYFTVSDLRLPFSSPPTTHRVTVEVFDPTSTRVKCVCVYFYRISSYITLSRTYRKHVAVRIVVGFA